MITLSARITSTVVNENPFILGESALGSSASLGETISLDIEVNKRNILSLENGIEERSDNTQPSWGIISNRGSLSFKDTDGQLKDYAERRILKKGAKCVITLSNTLSKRSSVVGTYYVEDWNYDTENQEVSVSLNDGLERWQDIEFDGLELQNPYYYNNQYPLYTIYGTLSSISSQNGIIIRPSNEAADIISKTKIAYAFLNKASLWSTFQKICEICGLYIRINKDGHAFISTDFGD